VDAQSPVLGREIGVIAATGPAGVGEDEDALAVIHEGGCLSEIGRRGAGLDEEAVDGWAVLQGIRKAGKDMPVLFLTARDQVQDRVHGLELGADDYMVKPFAFAELLARVRIHLRRGSKAKESEYLRIADLELDLMRRRVTRSGKRIDLTAKEFALLELLLRRQGEVLPRSLIASQVWDMNFDSDSNAIEVAMRRLRAKVDDGFEPKLIRTIRGMGYVMEIAE
jgi:two-component system copper resistance phosphate regulon response regulator CusR